ncbi:MAG: WbqC family protein [Trichodesmium sp. MAG_R04]|jgi:hypothetical protein|nr:WbqC family protein [Trichodesmium sp. MAG_R04]
MSAIEKNSEKKSNFNKCVAIIQSSYIPWRGYFDFIDSADVFVIYDDIQYSTGSWRNRNQIKTKTGLKWLTVPVHKKTGMLIDEVSIDRSQLWQNSHRLLLKESLGFASYFKDAMEIWEEGIAPEHYTISKLNIKLINSICNYLEITTPIVMSRDYHLTGAKTERLIGLIKKIGGTIYLSGPTASAYLDENQFRENGISLQYKTYDYPNYPQLWGNFLGNVSVLDLIANTGKEARQFLKSQSNNIIPVS